MSTALQLKKLKNKKILLLFAIIFAVAGSLALAVSRAAINNDVAYFEAENGTRTGSVSVETDSLASGGSFLRFNDGQSGINLPAPIDPGDRDFGRIVRQTKPNGGIIVLPDGEYKVSDVAGFNPSAYVVIVAENPLGVKVVRTSNTLGATDQAFSNSSKLIFVGIEFKNIATAIGSSSDIHFWHTRHTYPIEAHPDPTETYCGNAVGPEGITIGNSNRIGVYGVDIDDIGHDAVKLNNADNTTLTGIKIMNVDHGGLQEGRGNSRCGWDGTDNYHDDGIQIFPGGVDNLIVENSYIGRHALPQVDSNGTTNSVIFRNNTFYEEPPHTSCLAINARVKTTAQAGAKLLMTLQNNDAWCRDSQWLVYTGESRDLGVVINGTALSSTTRNASQYVTRRTGTPDRNNTPAEVWRASNQINTWPCFFETKALNFTQNVLTCS